MRWLSFGLLVALPLSSATAARAATSQRVYYDEQGRLRSETDDALNRIPDFSHAGYAGGARAGGLDAIHRSWQLVSTWIARSCAPSLRGGTRAARDRSGACPEDGERHLGEPVRDRAAIGRSRQGLATAEKALAIYEAAYGPNDRHIVGVLFNAGKAALAAGQLERARVLLERAVAFAENNLRPDHPHAAVSRLFLADVLVAQGAWSEASPHARAAVDTLTLAHGADDPRMESAYRTLATVLARTGQLEEAERLAIRTTELAGETFGHDNLAYASALRLLGWIRFERGACDQGAAAYDEAVAALDRSGRSRELVQSRAQEEAACRRAGATAR